MEKVSEDFKSVPLTPKRPWAMLLASLNWADFAVAGQPQTEMWWRIAPGACVTLMRQMDTLFRADAYEITAGFEIVELKIVRKANEIEARRADNKRLNTVQPGDWIKIVAQNTSNAEREFQFTMIGWAVL